MIQTILLSLASVIVGLPVSAAWPTLPPRKPWPELPAKIEVKTPTFLDEGKAKTAEPLAVEENPFAAGTAANESQRVLEKTIQQNPPAAASPSCPGGRCSQPRGIILRRWR